MKPAVALLLALALALALAGCDVPKSFSAGKYSLFETSKGVVYRLNTGTGETEIIYSPVGLTKLTAGTLYEADGDKTYEYLGGGQLKELSVNEVADRLVRKYAP